jgi:hypothetical protein
MSPCSKQVVRKTGEQNPQRLPASSHANAGVRKMLIAHLTTKIIGGHSVLTEA